MHNIQRAGGFASLIMAGTFIVAFAIFLGVLMPAGYFDDGILPAEKVAIIADNHALVTLGYLIPYVGWGFLLVALVLALYDRLKTRVPVLAQLSTVFGLIWAVVVIASGLIAVHGIRIVSELHVADPALATSVWIAIETVFNGIGGEAGEVVGGAWLLLTGWAGLKSLRLSKSLSYLAIALGLAGVITVVPLFKPALALFGIGLIVWFIWLGVYLLRNNRIKTVGSSK